MSSRRVMSKAGRDVLRAFKKAGLEVELRCASKHYLVYHDGELVYKFSHGTTAPPFARKTVEHRIRRIKEAKSPNG